jgi:hypothetical protein
MRTASTGRSTRPTLTLRVDSEFSSRTSPCSLAQSSSPAEGPVVSHRAFSVCRLCLRRRACSRLYAPPSPASRVSKHSLPAGRAYPVHSAYHLFQFLADFGSIIVLERPLAGACFLRMPGHELPPLQETDAEPDRISVAGPTPDPSGLVAAVARNAATAVQSGLSVPTISTSRRPVPSSVGR